MMGAFTNEEIEYLDSIGVRLGRLATVGPDGTPHIAPVGFSRNGDAIEIGGHDMKASKKFRDIEASGRAAFVVDDVASESPWRPRGVEVRGRAEAVDGGRPVIRIHPERIVSWGLAQKRHARDTG